MIQLLISNIIRLKLVLANMRHDMTTIHNLGFPRIGKQRELKFLLERYWAGEIGQKQLEQESLKIKQQHWQYQAETGVDLIPVNDFSLYDQVLDMSALLGVIPERFGQVEETVDIDTYFRMARGQAPSGESVEACEMTKWFDTNYHYIVPEFNSKQTFRIAYNKIFDEIKQVSQAGHQVKPVLIGPLTYLWLGKVKGQHFDKLSLLEDLIPVYEEILQRISKENIEWVQIDEPILVLDLPEDWQQAFHSCYDRLSKTNLNILLATYFDSLNNNFSTALSLPVDGLHIDVTSATTQLDVVLQCWPKDKVLSLGVVDGRNVWAADLNKLLSLLKPVYEQLGERLWLAASCSLLHCPIDVETETQIDAELKSWFAFAVQKLGELSILRRGLEQGSRAISRNLRESMAIKVTRKQSKHIFNQTLRQRLSNLDDTMFKRQSSFAERIISQQEKLNLPLFSTTTIGSFPQTQQIRELRRKYKTDDITKAHYETELRKEIKATILKQEQLGLDVLVHGEAERNDMVEYFGEQLAGFAFTKNGWVQSYGSRCVKPPIIYGDVSRNEPMTVAWSEYAQSITEKPVKGMLTGPVTILQWSFVRDDQPRATTCKQIALALRDEVADLEKSGIKFIQIDEPALREGLPLKKADWSYYLDWSVAAFKLASSGVEDCTQIHTHMCYAEFNDIIEAIAKLDADVITLETSRSDIELLDTFSEFDYPNQIGPGVYDIHSPRIVTTSDMVRLIHKAQDAIASEQLWINPDCGLKTRDWIEVEECLKNMVQAAIELRQETQKSFAA